MNAKLEILKTVDVEDRWNNYRKTICEVADGVLRNKVRSAARNIGEKFSV